MNQPVSPASPVFRFDPAGLGADEAFQAWREIMSRMFGIARAHPDHRLPQGSLASFVVGDLMANRSTFNVQRLTRDRRQVVTTPDHLMFQLYRSGGFAGEIGGRPVRLSRGQVAVCDLRQTLDVRAVPSETFGLTLPRHLLDGVALDRVGARLDERREQLLAARMLRLHRGVRSLTTAEVPGLTAEMVAAVRCLLDPSDADGVLESPELDVDHLAAAEQVIADTLGSPDLSPAMLAERLHVSRATLYRVFAPVGGVMQHVWSMRLDAVRDALDRAGERRTLGRLAAVHGFRTAAHLSRGFRARFGMPPREWRAAQATRPAGEEWRDDVGRLNRSWRLLGRDEGEPPG